METEGGYDTRQQESNIILQKKAPKAHSEGIEGVPTSKEEAGDASRSSAFHSLSIWCICSSRSATSLSRPSRRACCNSDTMPCRSPTLLVAFALKCWELLLGFCFTAATPIPQSDHHTPPHYPSPHNAHSTTQTSDSKLLHTKNSHTHTHTGTTIGVAFQPKKGKTMNTTHKRAWWKEVPTHGFAHR